MDQCNQDRRANRLPCICGVGLLVLMSILGSGDVEWLYAQSLTPRQVHETDGNANDPLQRLSQAARRLEAEQEFEFKYQFKAGDVIRWQVEHAAATDTRVQNDQESTSSRSQSILKWQVTHIDALGNSTIQLTLESAKMWQQIDEQPPVEFDSRNRRGEVPEDYKQFAEWIGIPMATYQVSPNGQVIDRKEVYRSIKFGVGDITMPLPDRPVRIGQAWYAPGSIMVRSEDGAARPIRTRIEYRLQSVDNGIARVSFDTQVLTPVDDPRIESQLIQQMSKGEVTFDLNGGQMVGMDLGWNRRCLGFKGPESSLNYVARYVTRQLQAGQADEVTGLPAITKSHLQPELRLAEDGPIFRW